MKKNIIAPRGPFYMDNNEDQETTIEAPPKIEEQLKEKEEQFKRLFEVLPYSVSIYQKGIVVFVNEAAQRVFGVSSMEELIGQPVMNFVHPDSVEPVLERIKLVGKGFKVPVFKERLLRPDGTSFDAEVSAIQTTYNGSPAGLVVYHDITEQELAEKSLIESEKRYRMLFNQSPAGVLLLNLSGNFVEFNEAANKMFGYTREEFAKLNISELNVDSKEKIRACIESLLKNGKADFEARYRAKDGQIRDIHVNSQVIEISGQTLFHSIWEDITERKKVERELTSYRSHLEVLVESRTKELGVSNAKLKREVEKGKVYEKKLQESLLKEKELNDLKTRFISTASHEFRTPLTLIQASADLLDINFKNDNYDNNSRYIEKIQKSVDSMTELLDEVLIINRAESGKISFEPTEINLYKLCNDLIDTHYEHQLKKHNIVLNYNTTINIIIADPKIIHQILNNLIGNAIKYSPEGGDIILKVSVSDEQTEFKVIDSGIGIHPLDISHLFESFYRGKNVGRIKGSGLGLSIVQKSAMLHGGSVKVECREDKGSIFTVLLKTDIIK